MGLLSLSVLNWKPGAKGRLTTDRLLLGTEAECQTVCLACVIAQAVYLVTHSLIVRRVYTTQQMLEFVVMLQMKLFILFILQFTMLSLLSQEHKDYIVKLNKPYFKFFNNVNPTRRENQSWTL
jgi:hypothetical protein